MFKIVFVILLFCVTKLRVVTSKTTIPTTRRTTYRPILIPPGDPLIDPKYPKYYNPNWGYEPYWVNGEWVIRDPFLELSPYETTTKIPLVCGQECEHIYRDIKHVCAHKSDRYDLRGCSGWYCTGQMMKNYTTEFTTFNTYCEFLNTQCKKETTYARWILVYVGKCVHNQELYFRPLHDEVKIKERADMYLAGYEERFGEYNKDKKLLEELEKKKMKSK